MFEHAHEYRRVNRALLGSDAEALVHRRIHSVLARIVWRELKLELQSRKRGNAPISPDLLSHFLVSTCISLLTWWLDSKNPASPKDIDVAYRHLVLPCPRFDFRIAFILAGPHHLPLVSAHRSTPFRYLVGPPLPIP